MSLTDRFNGMDQELYLSKQAMLHTAVVDERDKLRGHFNRIHHSAHFYEGDQNREQTLRTYLNEGPTQISRWGSQVVAAINKTLGELIPEQVEAPVRIVTDGEKAQIIFPTFLRDSSVVSDSILKRYFMELVDRITFALGSVYGIGSTTVKVPANFAILTYEISNCRIVEELAKTAKEVAKNPGLGDGFSLHFLEELKSYYQALGINLSFEWHHGRLFSLTPAPETTPLTAPQTTPAGAPDTNAGSIAAADEAGDGGSLSAAIDEELAARAAEEQKPARERVEVRTPGKDAGTGSEAGGAEGLQEYLAGEGVARKEGAEKSTELPTAGTLETAVQTAPEAAAQPPKEEDLAYLLTRKTFDLTLEDIKKLEAFLRYSGPEVNEKDVSAEQRLTYKTMAEKLGTLGIKGIPTTITSSLKRKGILQYIVLGKRGERDIGFFPASEIERLRSKAKYLDVLKKYYVALSCRERYARKHKGQAQPDDTPEGEPKDEPEDAGSLVARINQTKVDELKGRNRLIAEAFANNPQGVGAEMPVKEVINYVYQHGPKQKKSADVEGAINSIRTSICQAARVILDKTEQGVYKLRAEFIIATEPSAKGKGQAPPAPHGTEAAAAEGEGAKPEGITPRRKGKASKESAGAAGGSDAASKGTETVGDTYINEELKKIGKADDFFDVTTAIRVAGTDNQTGETRYLKDEADAEIKKRKEEKQK